MIPATTTTDLHWCSAGEIACSRHAPTPGSSLYQREEWRPMSAFDAELLAAYRGEAPSCPHCTDIDADEDAP